MLPEGFKARKDVLTLNKFKAALEKINLKKTDIVELSGGEPTLNPYLLEILEHVKDTSNAKTAILTNGELLSNLDFAKKIANYADECVVCVYTLNEALHKRISAGSLKKKMAGIQNMHETGIKLHIKTLVTKLAYKEIPEIVHFCVNNLEGAHVNINALHIANGAWKCRDELAVKFTEAKPYYDEALLIGKEQGEHVTAFVPMCLLDPYFWDRVPVNFGEMIKKALSIDVNGGVDKANVLLKEFLIKPDKCKKCLLKKRCFWPYENYIKLYGDKELVPIR